MVCVCLEASMQTSQTPSKHAWQNWQIVNNLPVPILPTLTISCLLRGMQGPSGPTSMTLFIIFLSLSVSGFSHTKYFHCVKLTPDDSKIRLLNGIYCLEDMTSSLLNNNTASQFSAWERTPSYAPTPGDFGRERTPSKYCLSLNHTYGGGSTPLGHPESCRLGFLDKSEYHDGTYSEGSPSSIIYLIEWKVTLNNQILAKNTEQDLVLKPSSYWQQIKEKADHVGQRKITRK